VALGVLAAGAADARRRLSGGAALDYTARSREPASSHHHPPV